MRNPLRFVFLLLYIYYYRDGDKTKDSAYIQASSTFCLLITANISALLGLFGVSMHHLMPFSFRDPTWLQYLEIIGLFALPGMLLVEAIMRKDLIVNWEYSDGLASRVRIFVPIYFMVSFIATMIFVKW